MKPGRNEQCPCGSGKKYKRCCLNSAQSMNDDLHSEMEQILAMNPNLTLDEINCVLQSKVDTLNQQGHADFCGLSPDEISNWLYARMDELRSVTISTPQDISASPVMRYLEVILNEALDNGGVFKATAKGNLPAKLVKKAAEILPELAVARLNRPITINDYAGVNEDKFIALHYTRVLAEIAGIITLRSGRYHVNKATQARYQKEGLRSFFKPMLEAAVTQYNWAYLDTFDYQGDLRVFWVFMLWRLQGHGDVEQLADEVRTAFPDILLDFNANDYLPPEQMLGTLIESRFVDRFLQFWGFVVFERKYVASNKQMMARLEIQPLLSETFEFAR